MEKFLLTFELTYTKYKYADKSEHENEYVRKKITIGVFDDFDTAAIEGNKFLEMMESKFPIHKYPNGHNAAIQRFSKNGGMFGSRNTLISNLAYLSTPFSFYAKIETLKMLDPVSEIDKAVLEVKDYNERRAVYEKQD